ncbi:MAG: L,D-transpeptidase [Pseudomonadota bacterium]
MRLFGLLTFFFAAFMAFTSTAAGLPATSESFDDLVIGGTQRYTPPSPKWSREEIAETQVLLDRAGFSPGVIDGKDTQRFRIALETYNAANPGNAIAPSALPQSDEPLFIDYAITAKDVHGPFTPNIPVLYVNQASLAQIGFRNAREMLAERFHVDENYLQRVNPGADFSHAGTKIKVPNVGRFLEIRVARIEADKSKLQLRAYAINDRLIAAYPASIGSQDTPSPTGAHRVRNKAQNPQYTYDPNGSAQPGLSKGLVRLPAGPNGPVGDAWIGLSKRTYGIHGTPEPSEIGITASVGCVRLTNWDALELARLVRRGVEVSFIE